MTIHMRVGFVYEDRLRAVGYEMNMDLTSTFGDVLESTCILLNFQEDDFVFLFGNKFTVVQKDWTPEEMGMNDGDYVKIYCVRKTNPLLLSH